MKKIKSIKKFEKIDIVFVVLVTLISICSITPMLYIISVSLTDPDYYEAFKVVFIPKKISFDIYKYIIKSGGFTYALKSTLIITGIGTILNLIVTFTFAYGLTRKDLKFRGLFMSLVIFGLLFNPGIIPKYLLVKELGLMNTYWSCIIPVLTNSWSVIIAKSFLQNIPVELEEASTIDGCSPIQTFVKIIIPLSTASIATLLLFFAVGHWNVYIKPLMYISDSKMQTLQVYVRGLLFDAGASELGAAADDVNIPSETMRMGVVVLSMLPILMVYPFVQRFFIKGVMLGSVKG